MAAASEFKFLTIDGKRLETLRYPPARSETDATIVMLHEGLGSIAMWKDFPERVAETTGCGVLVYSRYGHGKSERLAEKRAVGFMHHEAKVVLPELLGQLEIQRPILFVHSDGGSIALVHTGSHENDRIRGLILEAPHVFVEDLGIDSIVTAAENYESGSLKTRLERYHGSNVECAFRGWNEVWLNPGFRSWNIEEYLPQIKVPVMVIQGADDQYGTWRQVEAIERGCAGHVRTTLLKDCGHSPHRDQPDATLRAVTEFLREELQIG